MPAAAALVPRHQVVEIPAPIKGVDQGTARHLRDPQTCDEMVNVDVFPPFSDRDGIGKRCGTRRVFTNACAAAGGQPRIITGLDAVPGDVADNLAPAPALGYVYPTADKAGYPIPSPSWAKNTGVSLNRYLAIDDVHGAADDSDYVTVQCRVQGAFNPSTGLWEAQDRWTLGAGAGTPATAVSMFARVRIRRPTSIITQVPTTGSHGVIIVPVTGGGTGDDPTTGPGTEAQTITTLASSQTSADLSSPTDANCAGNIRFTLYYDNTGAGDWRTIGYLDVPFTQVGNTWINVDALFTDISAVPAACWNNAARLAIGVVAGENGQCGNCYVDVSYAHAGWGTTPPPPPPGSGIGKLLILLPDRAYVANVATDNLGTASASTAIVNQFPSFTYFFPTAKWYVVDGGASTIIDPATDPPTITDWPTAVTGAGGGTLPDGCTLVAGYRNRIVLAKGSQWFLSASQDPLDWNFAADSTDKPAELAAVAGSNHFTTDPPDPITALISWSDDLFLFMCANSIWKLDGDPADGGDLQNVTRQTGCLSQRSWCFDEFGTLWWVGSSGLYRMTRDGAMENVSGRRVYRYLDRIDSNSTLVQLVYDAFAKKVRIFVTPLLGAETPTGQPLHIVYDLRRDAFTFDTYPPAFGPTAVCRVHGATPDDRRWFIGSPEDGFLRRPFDGGPLDTNGNISPLGTIADGCADDLKRDGTFIAGATTAIESSVRYAPVHLPDEDREIIADELTAYGVDNNFPLSVPMDEVSWYLLAGNSAAHVESQAVQANAKASGRWLGNSNFGMQTPARFRVRGGVLQLVVRQHSATASWALGRVVMRYLIGPRRRG